MTTLIVDVEPNVTGKVGSLQPAFIYSKDSSKSTCAACVVSKCGDIELGSYAANKGVDIQFVLQPQKTEIGGNWYTASLGKDALTIFGKCTDPTCQHTGPSALTKVNDTTVHSPNVKSDIHKYSLEVTLTGQGPALSVKHDPKIKNGGFGIELTATTIAVALAVTALAAFIGFKLGARRMKMAASAPKPDSYR